MHDDELAAYCRRIGYTGELKPSLDTAAALLSAHLRCLPFETLDPYLGREVRLDLPSLIAKLVHGGRGGYCYEHNLLLAAVLKAIGLPTTGLAARVRWAQPAGTPPRPRTHMLLRLDLPDGCWLLDAGFGGQAVASPLRLGDPRPRPGLGGPLRLVEDAAPPAATAGEATPLQLVQWHDGEAWRDLYAFDLQPQSIVDYEMASWFIGHHPDSLFRQVLMAARCHADGSRLALRDGLYSRIDPAGRRVVERVPSPAALRDVLADAFGLDLSALDGLDQALGRAIANTPGN